MKNKPAEIFVQAWESNEVLQERYSYTTGTVEPLPKHSHEEYQFGFSFNCQGEYYYRGVYHSIPVGSLSIIHSGELHAPSDRTYLSAPADFKMMHIKPDYLQQIASEMGQKPTSLPFFPVPFINDPILSRYFSAVNPQEKSKLSQDVALGNFLSYLIKNHAANTPVTAALKSSQKAVKLAREYLHAHYTTDISLQELAEIAGLSRFHFCRIFRKELGVSPNTYQTQLRIAQSKKLLLQGIKIAKVAAMTGFYDQSHFGWHFKRQIGVTPKRYIRKQQ